MGWLLKYPGCESIDHRNGQSKRPATCRNGMGRIPLGHDKFWHHLGDHMTRAQSSLAADGAIACFSRNRLPLSLDAGRASQLKASVEADRSWSNKPNAY